MFLYEETWQNFSVHWQQEITSYERIASCAGTQIWTRASEYQVNSATHYLRLVSKPPGHDPSVINGLALAVWYHTPGTTTSPLWAGTILHKAADTWHWLIDNLHYPYLLISMLWHRQAIFESKGDQLSSSAECRIRTQGLRHLFASRLNTRKTCTYMHVYSYLYMTRHYHMQT